MVRFLDDAEREKLLEACRESDNKLHYAIVVLSHSTGARRMETLGLTWKHFDLKADVIRLTVTKNGECRVLPLVGNASELVETLSKVRRLDTQLLFAGKNPQTPVEIRKPLMAALEKAEIENFRFHDLRHHILLCAVLLSLRFEILGHKTLAMVKRYAHLSEAHTASVVERVNKKYL